MLQTLNRWFYWALALTIALLGTAWTLWLHQIRPDEGVIRLVEARFVSSDQHEPPPFASPGSHRPLPDDWRGHPEHTDTGWYLAELNLEVAPNRLWSIYIPALEMTPGIFINGTLIGGDPAPKQPLDRYWNRPILFSIPNGLLRPGSNQIAIRLEANGAWGRLSELYLAPREALEGAYEQRFFWRVTFLNVTTVGSLMLALFMGVLSYVRRDSIYSWFAAFTFSWHLQNLFFLTVAVPYANHLWDFTAYAIIGLMATTYAMFTFRFLGIRRPRWERFTKSVALVGPLVLLPLLLISTVTFNLVGSMIWIGLLLALATYPAFLIVRTLVTQQNTELFFLTICFTLTFFLGVHDWLVTSGLGYRHNGMLMQFAAAPTLAVFGAVLLRRFVFALRETQTLNEELEQRVADKAREIESSYVRNKELENTQLLLRERERIMRDMHDGVGSQLIGMMGHLNRSDDDRDETLARDLEAALTDLRLVIDSLDDVDNDVVVALGLFRNRVQPQLDAAGLTLEWRIHDLPPVPNLGPERVLHFMRILQEAITNTVKHAEASCIVVRTEGERYIQGNRCACVSVSDDGIGIEATHNGGGRGLNNMRYRAAEADLALEVEPSEGGGTTVRVGFPLDG